LKLLFDDDIFILFMLKHEHIKHYQHLTTKHKKEMWHNNER